MITPRATDFQRGGLGSAPLEPRGRQLVLTVDFEGFERGSPTAWAAAMEAWAATTQSLGVCATFFVALEDVVRLRAIDEKAYALLVSSLSALGQAGVELQPHNHCLFDPVSGDRPGEPSGFPQRVPGYARRASGFYDVVHRNRCDWDEWMTTLRTVFAGLLGDAQLPFPAPLAFRPGGWDHGSDTADMERYLDGLVAAGVRAHSGATSGQFGTRSWRVGAPFGENVFTLRGGIVELSPSWFVDMSAGVMQTPRTLRDLAPQPKLWARRLSGALVAVVHFDHLFHERRRVGYRYFAIRDRGAIERRVVAVLRHIRRAAHGFGLEPVLVSASAQRLDDQVLAEPALQSRADRE